MFMCTYALNTIFYACFLIQTYRYTCIYSFWIYCRSFNFLYVTCHCLYLYAWTTSLDHVHVWLPEHASWLYHIYSLGCFLTTLDPHVQILESGSWRPCCSWSECVAKVWINGCLSEPSFFQPPLDRLVRFSSFYSWVLSPSSILYILLLRFLVILYSWDIISCFVITMYLYYYCWNVYYHCAFVLWFLPVLMLSVYTWGYFWPAYMKVHLEGGWIGVPLI